MQKVKISKRVGRQLYRSSPTILTVVASVGVVTTTIMAVRATPKAIKILKEAELEKGEDLSKLEIIRAAGPIYIPSVLLGVSTIACIFGANAKDKVEKNPVVTREVIITEKGNTLCYDAVSGRYFKGDIEKIKKAECELNRQMRDEMYISLNDFYYEIGLDNIKLGDELGWNIDDGYIDLSFSSQLASDGTPCLVIDYTIAPRYDFRNLR